MEVGEGGGTSNVAVLTEGEEERERRSGDEKDGCKGDDGGQE